MATIYKRGKTWWGRVQRGGRDIRQSLATTSRPVAERRLREWLDRLEALKWGEKPRRTYDEVMQSFLQEHCPRLRPASIRRYMTSARQLLPSFEGVYLDQITSALLTEYVSKRRATGASSPTIKRDLDCLSSMFGHAVTLEWCDVNPIIGFLKREKKRGSLRESPPRTRYLDHEEEAKLLAACRSSLWDHVAFAIDTGLRREEQWSLTWDCVNLSRQEILIPAHIAKGKKDRLVPLLPRSARILAQLPRHLRISGGPDWVFCHRNGSRFGHRSKGFHIAASAAGLKDLRWHDLRRTCGCRLLQDHRMRLEEARDWLGHQPVQQTERAYAFLRVDQLHRAVGTGTGTGTGAAERNAG